MSRRTGLGRGLAALIPPAPEEQASEAAELPDPPAASEAAEPEAERAPTETPRARPEREAAPSDDHPERGDRYEAAAEPGSTVDRREGRDLGYAEIDPERIIPNPRQPREVFDPEELEGLATSLADIGMLQPLVVRPLADGGYELIAGERRWRAARLAGLERVPALVRHTEDADLLKEALVENIHRVQLNPLEEAAAYQQLLQEFDVTQEELATRLGRSRPSISNAIRLLQLPAAVQRRVAAGVLSAGHAKVLLALPDHREQLRLAERIVAEGLSVRATEEHVRLRLTEGAGPRRSPAPRTPTAPGLVELQDDLSDALQARVRISMGARKGRLAVEFTSVEELERIVAVIADGLAGGPARAKGDAVAASGWDADEPLSPWEDDAP
ncbi:MAG: ParB/RepB/Spo0J family partition protein [Nitriliruptoraceae bacterium]